MNMEHIRKVGEAPVKLEFIIPSKSYHSSKKTSLKDDNEENNEITKECVKVKDNSTGKDDNTTHPAINGSNSVTLSERQDNDTPLESNEVNGSMKMEDTSNDNQPPKKKQKGQNKARPRTVPKQKYEDRLCPKLLNNDICIFGDNCKFSHDLEKYVKTKPSNLGDVCLNYTQTGKCRYGIECMFSKGHITEDYKNIIDTEKYENYWEENNKYINALKREVLISVRKKKYKFLRTEEYLKKGNINGNLSDSTIAPLNPREKKTVDFAGKLYLAPLTTVGNLPFRKVCKQFGADITCGEMAMSTNLLQCSQAEWALIKRHPSEDIFGVQLCGGYPDTMTKVTELLSNECNVDFIDINMGCPIDLIYKRGEGSALMRRMNKLENIIKGMVKVSDVPITIKMRTGVTENKIVAHDLIPLLKEWGVDMMTLHGRTREQRYTKSADWDYINYCAEISSPIPFFGNGDILSFEEVSRQKTSGVMIARGALIKPWIFTEIKEQRHWDISSNERLDILKDFTDAGLMHWGSDFKGVENTRRFLLEWLSFLHRYIPVGLLEVLPQKINERAPSYFGRNDLETLFISEKSSDWVKISELLLGPVPDTFNFIPKHKANAYSN